MFDQVLDNLRKATEMGLQMQQEMLRKWTGAWPGLPVANNLVWTEQVQKFQKNWNETINDMLRQQRQNLESQLEAGMKNLDEAFKLTEAKSPEEVRTKTLELWRKTFESLRQTFETQMKDFQAAVQKWTEMVSKGTN